MLKSSAYCRLTGARLVRQFPAIGQRRFETGNSAAHPSSSCPKSSTRITGRSRYALARLLQARSPESRGRHSPSRRHLGEMAHFRTEGHATSVHPAGNSEPGPLKLARSRSGPRPVARDEVAPLSPALHRIHFTASEEFVQKLEKVKDAWLVVSPRPISKTSSKPGWTPSWPKTPSAKPRPTNPSRRLLPRRGRPHPRCRETRSVETRRRQYNGHSPPGASAAPRAI